MVRFLLPALLLATQLEAQVTIRTEPEAPARGSLIRIYITPNTAQLTDVNASVADEPLHLSTTDQATWSGLAGIPVDGGDTVLVQVTLTTPLGSQVEPVVLKVRQPPYPSEKLTVAPGMAEPDSLAQARIKAENRKARAVGTAAHGTERLWSQPFRLPRTSRITSQFGTAREFNGSVTSRHMGTDFAGAIGAPVRAANRGRVVLVDRFYLAGRVVYIDHGEGLISAYFHLTRALVTVGQVVERGQLIGTVGRSGRVTGPHLHWVMRYGNTTVDPITVVALTTGSK
ncbi:MAG TPA: M23 family metallopeptidase [Gemmatimonadales bacterium]|nr:M23 family metallopeptidase [Gemmatimonadales bacterium]